MSINQRELNYLIEEWKKLPVRIIAISGARRSGKDSFLRYIEENYEDFQHLRIAEAPVLIAKLLHLEPTREVLHALFGLNDLLRPVVGEAVYKRRVARILDTSEPPLSVVESVRTEEEYKEFVVKRRGILVGLAASPRVRYNRAAAEIESSREKSDETKMTFDEFLSKENHPIEREIAGIVSRAHFLIENNFESPEPFHREIDLVMSQLGVVKKKH